MTDEGDQKSIWSTVVFGLAVFMIILGVLGLFTPAQSQTHSYQCASMSQVGNTLQSLNAEPEMKGLEWFEHFKEAFARAGYVFNDWPENLENVFVVVSNTQNVVMIGYIANGCIIDSVTGMQKHIYDQTVALMDRERM